MTYLYDTVKTSARIARQGAATSTVAISPALRGAALPKLTVAAVAHHDLDVVRRRQAVCDTPKR
jgi:hypothetical protein